MATINDKLTYIEGTKDAIKQAIIAKGVSVSDSDTFRSYASKINDIESGGGTTFTEGTKFGYSTWSTIPNELIPYLESISNMKEMFINCFSLTAVPLFDTANVTNMNRMFSGCKLLTTLPLFDTANVNDMGGMFANCSSLTTLPLFDTAKVSNMGNMLYYCSSLTTLPLFDTTKVSNMGYMFNGCKELTTLGGFTGLKVNLDLSSSSNLTVESVMNVINNAADMTSSPKTLTLHKTVFAKLSQEQKATATAKGWNIASK